MTSLESFESLLKEVVQAKRLSVSKVDQLKGIAMKLMQDDTQLVSILYRTHKGLSAPYKVASLYAFDALARGARSQVNKNGISGDLNTRPGNCATFLIKLEGVLDGLVQDMVSSGQEGKEKTKKILDIWVKANTFPSAVLTRLVGILKDATPEKVTVKSPTPSGVPAPPPQVTPPTGPFLPTPSQTGTDSLQSTLLALLSQAANQGQPNGQTATNTSLPLATTQGTQLDPNSLALFRQLTQTAQLANAGPSSSAPVPPQPSQSWTHSVSTHVSPPPAPAPAGPGGFNSLAGPSQQRSVPYQDDRYDSNHREPRWHRPDESCRGGIRESLQDSRGDFRGRSRGGFRGRGRGRWEDRDRYGDRDRERSPVSKGRRSRSRSPPRSRYGGRRDVKPYSPPRRPSLVAADTQEASEPSSSTAGKDEFGRDLRPAEDDAPSAVGRNSQEVRSPPASASGSTDPGAPATRGEDHHSPTAQVQAPPGVPVPTVNSNGADSHHAGPIGLDSFDFSTFDPTAPTSWEALGKAWLATHGYTPGQEELVALVMGAMAGPMAAVNQPVVQMGDQWGGAGFRGAPSSRGFRGGRGRAGSAYRSGRGGRGYGNVREDQERWGYGGNAYDSNPADTDAVVLGGDTSGPEWNDGQAAQMQVDDSTADPAKVGSSGKMQRVGDKWVFVRSDVSS